MEDHKGDLIVIFAGYRDEMRRFADTNPGIRSRISYTFDFADYAPDELLQIYCNKAEADGFTVDERAAKKVRSVMEYNSRRKDFGNGRFADRLWHETLISHSAHINDDESNLMIIGEEDVPDIAEINRTPKSNAADNASALEQVIGLKAVKEKIKELENLVSFSVAAKERGLSVPANNMHMFFVGNPGTGKTSVARIIARRLYDIGVVREYKFLEVERKDLVGEHVGETAIKTAEVIEKAMGGILFVDEAYTLAPEGGGNDFGQEAIATLIRAMENHKEDLIVIFAGYEREMEQFKRTNPGIASRIGFTFHFEDYSADELCRILESKLRASGFSITPRAMVKARKLMQYFCSVENFGNGRFVDKIVNMALSIHARNYIPETIDVITEGDIPEIRDVAGTMSGGQYMLDPDKVTQKDLHRVAVHESGHALVQNRLFPDSPIKKITIHVEGNGALGYVERSGSNFGVQNTRQVYLDSIAVSMAGLAAEQLVLGASADGGSSDINNASNCARMMITKLGMSKYGFAGASDSADTAKEINEVLKEGFDCATAILTEYRDQLDQMVAVLLKGDDLTDADVKKLMGAAQDAPNAEA